MYSLLLCMSYIFHFIILLLFILLIFFLFLFHLFLVSLSPLPNSFPVDPVPPHIHLFFPSPYPCFPMFLLYVLILFRLLLLFLFLFMSLTILLHIFHLLLLFLFHALTLPFHVLSITPHIHYSLCFSLLFLWSMSFNLLLLSCPLPWSSPSRYLPASSLSSECRGQAV